MVDDENASSILWVGNLNEQVDLNLLFELFLQVGPISEIKGPKENRKLNNRNKKFAFVTFKHQESVSYAIEVLKGLKLFNQDLLLQRPNCINHSILEQQQQSRPLHLIPQQQQHKRGRQQLQHKRVQQQVLYVHPNRRPVPQNNSQYNLNNNNNVIRRQQQFPTTTTVRIQGRNNNNNVGVRSRNHAPSAQQFWYRESQNYNGSYPVEYDLRPRLNRRINRFR